MLACGGEALNSFESLSEAALGKAGLVYEHILASSPSFELSYLLAVWVAFNLSEGCGFLGRGQVHLYRRV